MKKILSILLALTMLVGLMSAYGTCTVSAEEVVEDGTGITKAFTLKNGVWHTKEWTFSNMAFYCYNKITIPSRGYITFTATKPIDSSGNVGGFLLTLSDTNSNTVWKCTTTAKKKLDGNYTYQIGLDAGTYYMNLTPDFYVLWNSAPIPMQYKYTFTATSDWEIEENSTIATATEITLGKAYQGVYGEESYGTYDCFKVLLTKGYKYRYTIGNYKELSAGTLIEDIFGPDGKRVMPYKSTPSGTSEYWEFVAPSTGYYYPVIYNESNDPGVKYTVKMEHILYKASECTATLSKTSYTYDGSVKSPSVSIKGPNGETLKKGIDYTATYASGCKAPGTYKVTVKYKGAYTGSKTLSFKINPINVSKCKINLASTAYTYDGKVKNPAVTVKGPDGKTLKKGTDYTVTYASGCKAPGTYKVTVKMKGNYTGSKTLSFKINPINVSKCKINLASTAYTFDGKVKKPAVTVKTASGKTLKKGTDYTVTYASGCKNPGTYKVTVKMKGNYTGSKTLTFTVNPPKTTVSKLTAKAKSIDVSITKKSSGVSGYEVQYSTSKSFANASKKTISSYNTTKYTLKSLKTGKTYYVRVRTFKTVNGKKFYSDWSAAKSVKVK